MNMEINYKTYKIVTEHEIIEKYVEEYNIEAQDEEKAKEIIAKKYLKNMEFDREKGIAYSDDLEKSTKIKINVKK